MGEKSVLGYKLCYLYSRESNTYAQDDILSLLSSAPTLEYTSTTYTLPEMGPTVEEETSSSNILGDFDT